MPEPDWSKWRALSIVTMKEAVCLSLGLDPDSDTDPADLGLQSVTAKFKKELRKRVDICERELHEFIEPVTLDSSRLQSKFRLRDFVGFANNREWELPPELRDLPDFTVKKGGNLSPEAIRLWARRDLWALWEISFLLLGREPDKSALNTAERNATRDDIYRAVRAGKLVPVGDTTPAEKLYDELLFHPGDVIGWASDRFPGFPLSGVVAAAGAAVSNEKPMIESERTSLLLIVAGLVDLAKLNLGNNSKTAVLIVESLDRMGVSIGQRTVESHLKRVKENVERRKR